MAVVTVRYWAGARAAAGRDQEQVEATSVQQLLASLADRDDGLAEVLRRSSVLLDGLVVHEDAPLVEGQTVEVLPPFAGG